MSGQNLDVVAMMRRFNMSASTARRLLRVGAITGEKVDGKWQTNEEAAENWLTSNGNWIRARFMNKNVSDVVVPSRLVWDLYRSAYSGRTYGERGERVPHKRFRELAALGFSFLRANPGKTTERYILLDTVQFVSIKDDKPFGPGPVIERLRAQPESS
jgi:hypothetical protein